MGLSDWLENLDNIYHSNLYHLGLLDWSENAVMDETTMLNVYKSEGETISKTKLIGGVLMQQQNKIAETKFPVYLVVIGEERNSGTSQRFLATHSSFVIITTVLESSRDNNIRLLSTYIMSSSWITMKGRSEI